MTGRTLDHMGDIVSDEWNDALARWQQAVADLETATLQHLQLRPMAAELGQLAEWEAQLDKALLVKTAVNDLADTLRGGTNWFKSIFGLSALRALPAVPLAVIVGSISAVVSVTYALYSYNEQLTAKWEYIKGNPHLTPQEVAEVLGADTSSPASDVKSVIVWIVFGGLLLKFGPELLKKARR